METQEILAENFSLGLLGDLRIATFLNDVVRQLEFPEFLERPLRVPDWGSTPRTSVGKCGSIRAHCSSLSQNKFLRMTPIPFQKRIRIVSSGQKINEF